jgi:stalled ribosome alternative rescue factor ArfA
MVRANDKIKRLQKYAHTGELANESVEDSFKDLAVYSLIALDLFRQELESDKQAKYYENPDNRKIVGKAFKVRQSIDDATGEEWNKSAALLRESSDPGDETKDCADRYAHKPHGNCSGRVFDAT